MGKWEKRNWEIPITILYLQKSSRKYLTETNFSYNNKITLLETKLEGKHTYRMPEKNLFVLNVLGKLFKDTAFV